MAALLAERVDDGHDAFCKAITALAARAGGLLAPHHEAPQLALGVIVGGGHTFLEGVGEERVAVREHVGTRAADVAQPKRHAALQVMHEERLEPVDEISQALTRDGAFLNVMPLDELDLREQEQPCRAAATALRIASFVACDLGGWHEGAQVGFVPGLPTRLPAARWARRTASALTRRIRGGRPTRVGGVLVQASPQLLDKRGELLDLPLELRHPHQQSLATGALRIRRSFVHVPLNRHAPAKRGQTTGIISTFVPFLRKDRSRTVTWARESS